MRPLGVTEQQACFVCVFLEQTADHVGLFHDGGGAGGRPQVSAVRLQRLDTTGQKTVLLDGGATHCLRPMRSEEEWEKAVEIPVFLASGTVTLRQVPGSETLITRDQGTQPIVPLAALVQLGIQVQWDEQGCEMKRSDGSKLPIYLDGGCPVMERWQGMDLMAEVEFFNSQKSGIREVIATRRLDAAKGWCSEKQARQALEIATLFPEVPAHLAAEIPGDNLVNMEKVPLNRRQRKRIAEAKSLTVHFFSGPRASLWTCCEQEGHVVLCVELQKGLDMHNRALVTYLEELFRLGKVDMLVAGPPHRSVSLSRFRDDNGPSPIRGRHGLMRFGLPLNTWANKQLCDQDSLLWLRLLWFCYIGRQANVDMEVGIEQPSDPEEFLPETRLRPQHGFPSFLSWPETFTILETCGLTRIRFDQGALGHPHKKPTEMLSSIPEVHTLDGMRITLGEEMERWSEDLENRFRESKAAVSWAPGLVRLLQVAIKRKQGEVERHGRRGVRQVDVAAGSNLTSERPVSPVNLQGESSTSAALRALKAKEAAESMDWKRHVEMRHQPCRCDGMACVQSQGREERRRRSSTPESHARRDAEHVPGLELAPDGFTRVLIGEGFRHHRGQLGMCDVSESRKERLGEGINLCGVACDVDSGLLESLDISQCLLGAGMALACTKHKLLGSLLLATAGIMYVSGRLGKGDSRPAQNEIRPQQELREGATSQKGLKDEAAHPPMKGIAGMAHMFWGDPEGGVEVDALGLGAPRRSLLSTSHGMEAKLENFVEKGTPMLKAFRAVGDPSRDQQPLPPPRNLALQRERDQARSLGTAHGDVYRHFEIPQPHGERERQWWEAAQFDLWPVGADKWIQTRDGLLIRTHSKLRRRSFHPLHGSVPVDVSLLRSERHTVIFPQDPRSEFVDPRPRFVESDEWCGNTTWSKNYAWRGYTVFVMKACTVDLQMPGQPAYVDPVLAAPKRAMRFRDEGQRMHPGDEQDQEQLEEEEPRPEAPSSSAGGYGGNGRMREPSMVQVNVNVFNSGGPVTPRTDRRRGHVSEATDSEFEFVTP